MGRQILLVEDDLRDIELTQVAIEACKLPHSVIVVHDGDAALDYLLKQGQYTSREGGHPDLVLLDLKLPTMDGPEVLKRIRFSPHLAAIPVIVLTSSSMEADLSRMRRLDIDDYLVKPLDLTTFAESLRRLLHIALPAFSAHSPRRL